MDRDKIIIIIIIIKRVNNKNQNRMQIIQGRVQRFNYGVIGYAYREHDDNDNDDDVV